jgi:predicted dienelactone hydrolase
MRRVSVLALVFTMTISALAADSPPAYVPGDAKPVAVSFLEQTWHDAARNRDVPVMIYFPLAGNREEYSYLGRYWAAHGYIVVHLQHLGSDTGAVLTDGPKQIDKRLGEITNDPTNAFNRGADVSFAIDELKKRNDDAKWPLHGRIDLEKIGLAGHSFGGNTAMMIAGQTFGQRQGNHVFVDARVKCIVAMSPPVVVPPSGYDKSFGGITIPVMEMTGTEDNWPISETANDERQAAFKSLTHCPAYLVTLTGADHFVFLGQRLDSKHPDDMPQYELIRNSSLAFFDAYLRGDDGGRKWLDDAGGLTAYAAGRHATAVAHEPDKR